MRAVRVIPAPEGGRIESPGRAATDCRPRQVLVACGPSGLNRGEITQARDRRSGEPITVGVEFAGRSRRRGCRREQAGRKATGSWAMGANARPNIVLADPRALMRVPPACPGSRLRRFPMCSLPRTTRRHQRRNCGPANRCSSTPRPAGSRLAAHSDRLAVGRKAGDRDLPFRRQARASHSSLASTSRSIPRASAGRRPSWPPRDKRGVDVIIDMRGRTRCSRRT